MQILGAGSIRASKISIFFYLAARIPQVMHHIDRDNFNMRYFWQYFAVTKHADAKEGWVKNAICNFGTKASVDEAIPGQQRIS